MKYRLFSALAIIMFSGNCFANNITFGTEGINLDIPNNFTNVTEYNVPPKALRDFHTSSKAILDDLRKAKAILYSYDDISKTEIYLIYNKNEKSIQIKDSNSFANVFNPEESQKSFESVFKTRFNAKLESISTEIINGNYYIVASGSKWERGNKVLIKCYSIIKDGVSLGYHGLNYSNNTSILDSSLRSILKSAQYRNSVPIPPKIEDQNTNQQSKEKDLVNSKATNLTSNKGNKADSSFFHSLNFEKMLTRGISKALSVFLLLGLFFVLKFVWNKLMNNGTKGDDSKTEDLYSVLPQDKNGESPIREIKEAKKTDDPLIPEQDMVKIGEDLAKISLIMEKDREFVNRYACLPEETKRELFEEIITVRTALAIIISRQRYPQKPFIQGAIIANVLGNVTDFYTKGKNAINRENLYKKFNIYKEAYLHDSVPSLSSVLNEFGNSVEFYQSPDAAKEENEFYQVYKEDFYNGYLLGVLKNHVSEINNILDNGVRI